MTYEPNGPPADDVICRMVTLLRGLTDEERVRVFDAIFSVWCQSCGRRQPDAVGCQCDNDE